MLAASVCFGEMESKRKIAPDFQSHLVMADGSV